MPNVPAKRGDLALIERTQRATYAFGSGRGTETTRTYIVAKVESVSRDGMVKAVAVNGLQFGRKGHKWFWQNRIDGNCYVAARSTLTHDVDAIVNQLGVFEFASVDAARTALQPFKA